MKKDIFLISLFLSFAINVMFAQQTHKEEKFIQISGVVVDADSLKPVPFVSILIKGTKRGTITDYYGFFTLVASPGDELQFFSLNHKNGVYKLDDTLQQTHYYIIHSLVKDTIQLPSVSVYPWPTKEEFKKAFLNLDLSDTDYDRAAKNLDRKELSYNERNYTMDAQANYQYAMQQQLTKMYSLGQYPTINLLNPIAWAQFIEAWRKGKFKNNNKK
ncbi:MAG: carboxypeptidase-like regulatory domain-containing protein [Bacteroidia bacterium]|nr:carboxypeptidase-like regulatory domain-containing protein [Bacteroidia bacterium]